MEHMLLSESKKTIIRIPDRPRVEDMEMLGEGYEGEYDEDKFGLIVLDECLSWLNSRSWNDKGRAALLDWFRHARKHGWDIIYIAQDIKALDKQMADSLCDYVGFAKRTDRLKIPFISRLVQPIIGKPLTFPRMHAMSLYYGTSAMDPFYETRWYRGTELYNAYDTRQVFKEDLLITDTEEIDMRASYTLLSSWHLEGRYLEEDDSEPLIDRLKYFVRKWPLAFVCIAVRIIHKLTRHPPDIILKGMGFQPKKELKPRNRVQTRPAIINGNIENPEPKRRYLRVAA